MNLPLIRPPRMDADTFLAWAIEEGISAELVSGEVVAMAPERLAHAEVKGLAYRALGDAAKRAKLDCFALPDGVSVQVAQDAVYEPDALLRCGPRLPGDTVKITDPVVVVEVLSRSTRALDTGAKLEGYFRLPSVQHYLILRAEERAVIHHARDASGTIATRILRDGELALNPPGIVLDIAALFPP